MCEPYHSIVQFSLRDSEADNLFRLQMSLGARLQHGLEIDGFYHFSEFGVGHSEALKIYNRRAYFTLPEETRYEGAWWNRNVRLDGSYAGDSATKDDALKAAELYSHRVCMGNIGKVKEFFMSSMVRSKLSRKHAYADRAKEMLNDDGKKLWEQHVLPYISNGLENPNNAVNCAGTVASLMKRELVVPEWAERDELWEGDKQVTSIARAMLI